jgi:hypothetical protein
MPVDVDLSFIRYPTQRAIVAEAVGAAHMDAAIIGLLLAGSFARGDATRLSDLDHYALVRDGCSRPFYAGTRRGILVEWHYADLARALTKLAQSPMAWYTYVDGRILYDPEGQLQRLTRLAHQHFATYAVPAEERAGIAHWLASAQVKVAAARDAGDGLRAAYIVTTTAHEVLVGLWAVNQRPLPPSGGIPAHLADLPRRPTHLPDWFERLMRGTPEERVATFEALCQWLVPQLRGPA